MRRARRNLTVVLAALLAAGAAVRAQETNRPLSFVNFNFDQVEIRMLVKLVGEMTGRRFVVDDKIAGKVTVVTPTRIPQDEVYPLFLSVLESSGYSVMERDQTYYVVQLPPSKLAGVPVLPAGAAAAQGVITKVIKAQHISAVELKRLLEPLVRGGKEGALSAFGPTNHLIITDTAESIREIEKIIADLDKPGSASVVEVVQLTHASAQDLAQQLLTAMSGAITASERIGRHMQQAVDGGTALPTTVVVVAAPHSNSLLLVGTPVQLDEMKRIVARMDVPSPSGLGRMNAIFLKYLTAEDAAKTLNDLLAKKVAKDATAQIAIEHNAANNALVVDASPQDFEVVRKLVDELDRIPQQVMVEILIAEVAVGRNLDLGVRLSTVDTVEQGQTTVVGSSQPNEVDSVMDFIAKGLLPQGLALGVAKGETDANGNVIPRVPLLIQALAQNRDIKILSKVPLWAQNNTEASVSVVENIPVLRSTIEGGSGTARDVIQNIDRLDVGIKLKFTPHVNPDREVLLKLNPSIEAIIDEGPEATPFTPTIAKREVSTTVTVPDRSTVVITGLIRDDLVKDVAKVPLLGDLPLLGWLFRSTTERKQRTNLLIFVTPHIVTSQQEAESLKQALQERTQIEPGPSLSDPNAPVGR